MFPKTYYPFELMKNINSTKINVITNNIFRLIEKNGLYEKIDGFLFCLRFCKTKKEFVLDFGTKNILDIQGITFQNYSLLNSESKKKIFLEFNNKLNNSHFMELIDTFKLKEYSGRCLLFLSDCQKSYFLGLYSLVEDRKLCKDLKCVDFFYKYSSLKELGFNQNLINKNYKYIDTIKRLDRCINFNLENKKKLSYKEYSDKNFKKNDWSVVYDYTLYLNEFINIELLNKQNNDFLSLVMYDDLTKKIITIPNIFYKKEFIVEKKDIDFNGYLLLPKVY